eukprot:16234752-Heterocapsa_arctica.AAC.1
MDQWKGHQEIRKYPRSHRPRLVANPGQGIRNMGEYPRKGRFKQGREDPRGGERRHQSIRAHQPGGGGGRR